MVPRVYVSLNSKRICVAGITRDTEGVLSVVVELVQGSPDDDNNHLSIQAHLRDGDSWQWGQKSVVPGDEIVIKLLPPGDFDLPRPGVVDFKTTKGPIKRGEELGRRSEQAGLAWTRESRICSKCNSSFKSMQSQGHCPVCGIVFLVD